MATITENALVARINRNLSHKNERLRTARGNREESDLGRHYIVDTDRNTITAQHINVESIARELGVLRAGESIATTY